MRNRSKEISVALVMLLLAVLLVLAFLLGMPATIFQMINITPATFWYRDKTICCFKI